MEPPMSSGTTRRRVELRIRRPPLTWFARPTVVVDGVGQPAQWGTGTWVVADGGGTEIAVYLYNRVWRWGDASIRVDPPGAHREVVEYRSGLLPLGRGRLTR
ncbi:hypothetical protein [Curtobacterium sp. RRHDQ10]|uniref:hypothetical protein n=1 Tax=Curtobacterium phyllosphaerae TaxID=3413379 RepID=UPI003BF07D16